MTKAEKAVVRAAMLQAKNIADEIQSCRSCSESRDSTTHHIGMTYNGWMRLVKDIRACARLAKMRGRK